MKEKNKKWYFITAIILIILIISGLVVYNQSKYINNANTTRKNTNINVNTTRKNTNIKEENCTANGTNSENIKIMPETAYKPIIYLYPTKEIDVNVKLLNSDKITCSYPKYSTEWKVIAKPNGDLIELENNKKLYALYYESENTVSFNVKQDGFIVKGENTANFLEEKLTILGLNEREKEEFIIYWLPKLEANKYNYIRFATESEINENMPLEITPTPDSVIRILMTYKNLEKPIDVDEQILETPKREGFVVVEWGGTEIK